MYSLGNRYGVGVWRVIGDAYRRAEMLRSMGFDKEARNEILTAIVVTLILMRIRCRYGQLDAATCSYVESILKHVIKNESYIVPDGIPLDMERGPVQSLPYAEVLGIGGGQS